MQRKKGSLLIGCEERLVERAAFACGLERRKLCYLGSGEEEEFMKRGMSYAKKLEDVVWM